MADVLTAPSDRLRRFLGAPVHDVTMAEAADLVLRRTATGDAPCYIVTPNAQHVLLYRDDKRFARAYEGAWLSLPDGKSLVWAGRLLRCTLRERVTGVDLFDALCARCASHGVSIFLLGGRPGAASGAVTEMARRYPGLRVAGTYSPPLGFEHSPAERLRILEMLRDAAPGILFVGLGAPKQELWIAENLPLTNIPVAIGVGASFDFASGMVRRAPRWIGDIGLEWLFRLLSEPRRLWRRYLVGNVRFAGLVLREFLLRRLAPRTSHR